MKVSELRIGNWVNIFLNDVDYNTIQIKVDDLYYILQKNGIYEPVPLTEEWFQKFERFYKDGEYWGVDINDYKYCFKYRDWGRELGFLSRIY